MAIDTLPLLGKSFVMLREGRPLQSPPGRPRTAGTPPPPDSSAPPTEKNQLHNAATILKIIRLKAFKICAYIYSIYIFHDSVHTKHDTVKQASFCHVFFLFSSLSSHAEILPILYSLK